MLSFLTKSIFHDFSFPFQHSVLFVKVLDQPLAHSAFSYIIFVIYRIINQLIYVDFVIIESSFIFALWPDFLTNLIFHKLNPVLFIYWMLLQWYWTHFPHLLDLTLERVFVVHQKLFLFGHLEKLWVCLNFEFFYFFFHQFWIIFECFPELVLGIKSDKPTKTDNKQKHQT